MKQLFSGVFFFLGKQKRESRHINATVWTPEFWRGWKIDRSLSQRWLLENNDALLPWAHLWLLFLSLKMVERKQQEVMSVPVMQQCCLVGQQSVRCMVAMSGKGGENSHCSNQMMLWAWTVPCFGYKATEKEDWCSRTAPKLKEKHIFKRKTSSCSQKKLRARVPRSTLSSVLPGLDCALSLHSNTCMCTSSHCPLCLAKTYLSFWMLQCFLPSSHSGHRCPLLLKCSYFSYSTSRE